MNRIEELRAEIENYEVDPYDFEEQYCDLLDECGPVKIGNLEYDSSHVLREVDPIAYRCGLIDYADSIELDEIQEYRELLEELEELEEEEEHV